jgi:uncharacterized YigZ family protein
MSNSRFIATVAPAQSAKDAHAFVHELRREMPDATHHVYAFRIGHGASIVEGMSDDGEPSGTAGPPALAVVRGSGVGDVVLVITRYFGGTKLGTGGLVAAYTQAAQAGFAALATEPKILRQSYALHIPYAILEQTRLLLEEFDALIDDETFDAHVGLRVQVPAERAERFVQAVRDLTAGKVTPQPQATPRESEPRLRQRSRPIPSRDGEAAVAPNTEPRL